MVPVGTSSFDLVKTKGRAEEKEKKSWGPSVRVNERQGSAAITAVDLIINSESVVKIQLEEKGEQTNGEETQARAVRRAAVRYTELFL